VEWSDAALGRSLARGTAVGALLGRLFGLSQSGFATGPKRLWSPGCVARSDAIQGACERDRGAILQKNTGPSIASEPREGVQPALPRDNVSRSGGLWPTSQCTRRPHGIFGYEC
jgi:hypothetical protein